MNDKEDFLSRWSRMKRDGADGRPDDNIEPAMDEQPKDVASAEDPEAADAEPFPYDESDIEKLGYDDDFTVFMKANAPEHLRRLALRKLWGTNPVFAVLDGLNDYDEDFTNAALAVEGLQSAYKVGKGYVTDDDETEIGEGDDDVEESDARMSVADADESDEHQAETAGETAPVDPVDPAEEAAADMAEADSAAPHRPDPAPTDTKTG